MYRNVGMAVPKTTANRCRDRAYKHCTNNPIPTSFFHAQCCFPVISEHNSRNMSRTKKNVGMGLFVQCLYALCLHLVSYRGFWHCHPYIPVHFWKMFYLLYIYTSIECPALWGERERGSLAMKVVSASY